MSSWRHLLVLAVLLTLALALTLTLTLTPDMSPLCLVSCSLLLCTLSLAMRKHPLHRIQHRMCHLGFIVAAPCRGYDSSGRGSSGSMHHNVLNSNAAKNVNPIAINGHPVLMVLLPVRWAVCHHLLGRVPDLYARPISSPHLGVQQMLV